MGQRKSESSTGIEPMASQLPVGRSNQLSYESLGYSLAQLVRAPNRYLGRHGFDSRRGLRFFLCPMLVSLLNNSSSFFITELKTYHL